MFRMKRAPRPEWARNVTVTVDEKFGQEQYQAISEYRQEILVAVQQAVEQYVNDDDVVSDMSGHVFPDRSKMTGEYYISDEGYSTRDIKYHGSKPPSHTGKRYLFSLAAHCLEKPWYGEQTDLDYLALEIHFEWKPIEQQVLFMGVDSSSI